MTRGTNSDELLSGRWLFVFPLVGAAVGAAAILWDYEDWSGARDWTDRQEHFAKSGPFLLWATLICAQTAAWGVALLLIHKEWKGLKRRGHGRHGLRARMAEAGRAMPISPRGSGSARLLEPQVIVLGLVVWVLAIAGAFAGAWLPHHLNWRSYGYLDHRWEKITGLGVLGATVAMYGVLGIWAVYGRLKKMLLVVGSGDYDEKHALEDIPRYLVLRQRLRLLLLIVGSLLGLTILTVGAERNAVTAWADKMCPSRTPIENFVLGAPDCNTHFPSEYMLIYGFFFTVLLAFAYFPAQLALLSVGRGIRDHLAPLKGVPDTGELIKRREKREALDDLLDLKLGTLGNFRAGLAILTPLIGSLTGLLLGTGG